MPRLNSTVGFLLRFAVAYLLLISTWPVGKESYGSYYRSLGNGIFGGEEGRRYVHFEANTERGWPANFDTLIVMANRDQLDSEGKGPQIRLALDTWQLGWIPAAFFYRADPGRAAPVAEAYLGVFLGRIPSPNLYRLFSLDLYGERIDPPLAMAPFSRVEKAGTGCHDRRDRQPGRGKPAGSRGGFCLVAFRTRDFRRVLPPTPQERDGNPVRRNRTSSA